MASASLILGVELFDEELEEIVKKYDLGDELPDHIYLITDETIDDHYCAYWAVGEFLGESTGLTVMEMPDLNNAIRANNIIIRFNEKYGTKLSNMPSDLRLFLGVIE